MSSPSPLRPPVRRRGRPPDPTLGPRLLDAAQHLLAEEGLPALNPDRLARRAGAGKAAIYRRWPDVHDLAVEAVHAAELVRPVAPGASLQTQLDQLAGWWSAPLTLPERAAAALLGADRQHASLRAAFARVVDRPVADQARALLAGGGSVDPARAELVGRVLRAQLVQRLVSGPVPAEEATRLAQEVVGRLLSGRGTAPVVSPA
ncbi:TetR family transcriptional regulator [Klenkia sp. LSe6-5]|uniref:TetR family transcriptional regulator n=1 Tax=Klenkia sesuvii TaxID=3103137 RepID=A0ABU8DP35_9ACTN